MPKCRWPGCGVSYTKTRAFQPVCSDHEYVYAVKKAEQNQERRQKEDRRQDKRRKEALKTRSDYIKEAQIAFNKYIRARAIRFNHNCISSGAPLVAEGLGGGFDCGHFRGTGSAPHLRFNMNNAWGQSKKDNRYGAGAHSEYRKGLIARRGLAVVEALEADNTPRKFDIPYLIRIRKIFEKKARRIMRVIENSA